MATTYAHPSEYMAHCPDCGTFVSPTTGVCGRKSCQSHNRVVAEVIPWPPYGVEFKRSKTIAEACRALVAAPKPIPAMVLTPSQRSYNELVRLSAQWGLDAEAEGWAFTKFWEDGHTPEKAVSLAYDLMRKHRVRRPTWDLDYETPTAEGSAAFSETIGNLDSYDGLEMDDLRSRLARAAQSLDSEIDWDTRRLLVKAAVQVAEHGLTLTEALVDVGLPRNAPRMEALRVLIGEALGVGEQVVRALEARAAVKAISDDEADAATKRHEARKVAKMTQAQVEAAYRHTARATYGCSAVILG